MPWESALGLDEDRDLTLVTNLISNFFKSSLRKFWYSFSFNDRSLGKINIILN